MSSENNSAPVTIDNALAYLPYSKDGNALVDIEGGMRIGVSGAQGTGITTTARGLATAMGVPLLSEVARTAVDHGFKLADEGSMKSQCAMWLSQYFLEQSHHSFVADRTVLDAAAHAKLVADITGDAQDRLLSITMANASAGALRSYRALFYTPIEFALPSDGFRIEDAEFQQRLDASFADLIERLGLDYVVLRGSIEERLDQARKYLDSL